MQARGANFLGSVTVFLLLLGSARMSMAQDKKESSKEAKKPEVFNLCIDRGGEIPGDAQKVLKTLLRKRLGEKELNQCPDGTKILNICVSEKTPDDELTELNRKIYRLCVLSCVGKKDRKKNCHPDVAKKCEPSCSCPEANEDQDRVASAPEAEKKTKCCWMPEDTAKKTSVELQESDLITHASKNKLPTHSPLY